MKDKKPAKAKPTSAAKIENPMPTGNSVCGVMKPVKKESLAKMGLTRTGGENHKGKI